MPLPYLTLKKQGKDWGKETMKLSETLMTALEVK